MKIPLYLPPCKNCNSQNLVWVNLNDNYLNHLCQCGYNQSGAIDPSVTIGHRGIYRSEFEYNNTHDYCLSIVFAAMAFEWELTRLFRKWTSIESLGSGEYLSPEQIEQRLIKHRSIYDKVKTTGKLLYPEGLDKYIKIDRELHQTLEGFPSLSLENFIVDFQENLFWPRNRIIHSGFDEYNREDAKKCYNIARLGITILSSMDQYRKKLGD